MRPKFKNWAFFHPKNSRHMNEYYAGILDFLKDHPSILLDCLYYNEQDFSRLNKLNGIICYALPPPLLIANINSLYKRPPPAIAITLQSKVPKNFARAYIDPMQVAKSVFEKLHQRHCASYAFCSSHTAFMTNESATLLKAYRRAVWNHTGQMPRLYRPIVTDELNLIPSEMSRFVKWLRTIPKPCGMFVNGDEVAKKMIDTCRIFGIDVPRVLRIISTGNSPIFCERTIPTLSSYGVNHEKAGFAAARALYRMTHDGISAKEASFDIPLPGVTERASTFDTCGAGRLVGLARSFIRNEIDNGHAPNTADIAHHLNVSRAKLHKDFATIVGHTLHDELADYRLERLAKLLKSSDEQAKILIARVGFRSVSQAKSAFRTKFGMTMSTFREHQDI